MLKFSVYALKNYLQATFTAAHKLMTIERACTIHQATYTAAYGTRGQDSLKLPLQPTCAAAHIFYLNNYDVFVLKAIFTTAHNHHSGYVSRLHFNPPARRHTQKSRGVTMLVTFKPPVRRHTISSVVMSTNRHL